MSPQTVYVTTRLERYFWLVLGVSVVLFGSLILGAWVIGYVLSFAPFRWF